MDPALKRDNNADVESTGDAVNLPLSTAVVDEGLNGLVEGVGRVDFGSSGGGTPPIAPLGENLEGRVPARVLRGLCILFSVGGMKSGKPSWLGDSGIVSRKGVEPPLAGGPHMFAVKPS